MIAFFASRPRWLYVLILIAGVLFAASAGVRIAHHGVVGWLRGDGPRQTEWEVRATLGWITMLIAGVVGTVALLIDAIATRVFGWRLIHAVRRERKRRAEPDDQ